MIQMSRKIPLLCFLLGLSIITRSQDKAATVRGRLVDAATQETVQDLQLRIPLLQLLTQSDAAGNFRFEHVPFGDYVLVIGGSYTRRDTVRLLVDREDITLGDLLLRPGVAGSAQQNMQIPTIALEDNDLVGDEDGGSAQGVSSMLVASRDPFLNTAAFVFGPYRFQPRGYNRSQQQIFINDAPVNDVETGDAFWNQWGGLNDVFRARSQTYGLTPSSFAFGGVNGTVEFDATAISQQKQTKITYSLSNRQYRNRLMLTHSSGLMKGGWVYTVSASRRWANEGFIDGTFYDGYSYFAGVSKLYKKHQFSLTTFGAPTRRGKSAPAIQEVYDLGGSNFYNPNWGYQDGGKRNARIANSFQPVFIFNHQYAPDETFRIYTAAAYQFGKSGNSSLDWYNAKDPRPDYYRYLPSWQLLEYNDPAAAEDIRSKWNSEPEKYAQIDWDRIYQVNYANIETAKNVDGIAGNEVTGKQSVYVIGNDIDDIRKYSFNTHAEKKFSDRLTVSGGVALVFQQTESYRELEDLLGGDFYLNLNQFAVQQNIPNASFNQYDLDNPNRLIREGDKYNYHYIARYNKGWAWAQGVYKTRKLDFFLAANAGRNGFSRDGKFRNGLFADVSQGRSELFNFTTWGTKGGVTYKINGRNYLFLNGGLSADAPTIENTFISTRTRNLTLDNPVVQTTSTVEGGYLLRKPGYNARVTGYVTDVKDAALIKRFFNDDPAYQTFVNYVLQGVNMRFIGTELALETRLTKTLSVTAVAAVGQAFYTSNPSVSVYRDNDTVRTAGKREVYIKNHYIAAGPQSAYSLGWSYRPKGYWINVNFNYFDRNYIDINPDRRTAEAGDLIDRTTPLYRQIFEQEKMPGAFTVDLSFSKSFPLSRIVKSISPRTYLYFSAGVNNLLNNTGIRTGGFEQLRYDFSENNPQKFPPKYFYGYGANYFINISLKF